MAIKSRKRLVIDACVLMSAGESEHPRSSRCRTFLTVALANSYRTVVTKDIEAEWNRHPSKFSVMWRAAMKSKRLLIMMETPDMPDLRAALELVPVEKGQLVAQKDVHLIQAALCSDRTVVSLDDKARRAFGRLDGLPPDLRYIMWVNPVVEGERAVEWLKTGSPVLEEWNIGATAG